MSAPVFQWSPTCEGKFFVLAVESAYEVTSKWRKNVFKLPSGSSGRNFVKALTRLYEAYGTHSPLECVAFKAAAVLVPLLLQQPAGKPTYKETSAHLARRLLLWDEGRLSDLLKEGKTIQDQLAKTNKVLDDSTLAKRFATMVFNNNFKGAMSLVAAKGRGGVLPLNAGTRRDMALKHPKAQDIHEDALIKGEVPADVHPVFFAQLDSEAIKKHALRTSGSAGVSQQEDSLWHKMVTAHRDTSTSLSSALALVAKRLVTEYVDPEGLEALLANRGIAIDKCPGLRPVGVGEIVRRIIGKAVMEVTGQKVQESVGSLQLCAGQPVGVESAIHTMRNFLDDDSSDGILLIDADNAFNRVNRKVALWNVQFTCPVMKHVLINFYRSPTRIFMKGEGGFELLSQEGTTQGCPLAMAMYAIALAPFQKRLIHLCNQVWFADDASGCDTFVKMRMWFDELVALGPQYGYYPSADKCILVSKQSRLAAALESFKGTGVAVQLEGSKDTGVDALTTGARHLGAAVGTTAYQHEYISNKVKNWVDSVKTLARIAKSEPHAAYSAYTHCLQSQWTFLCRAMPGEPKLFQPLEDAIRKVFIPSVFNHEVNDLERDLLSLPARMGGMGITKPTEECMVANANSIYVSRPLVRLVMRQEFELCPQELMDQIKRLRANVDRENERRCDTKLRGIMGSSLVAAGLKLALKACSEKGASSWVTAKPNYEHATVLHKGEFTDAVCIRYGWPLRKLVDTCACGTTFSVQHALDCSLGGFRVMQHNETRDVLAQCMREAGYLQVEVEPQLQELSGEVFKYKSANKDADARSDVKVEGFWSKKRQAFFDVKVVSPFAKSYAHMTPAALFRLAEKEKMREYGDRIREVEHADFNPMVFTCTGGMAPQCQVVVKRLAVRLAEKKGLSVSVVAGWLRCRLSFALLRSTLVCMRATRRRRFNAEDNIELAVSESHIDY